MGRWLACATTAIPILGWISSSGRIRQDRLTSEGERGGLARCRAGSRNQGVTYYLNEG